MNKVVLLLCCCLLFDLYPLRKIINRRDINAFDVFLLFSSLFFLIFPLKDLIFDHEFPEISSHANTAYGLLCFFSFLLVIDFIWTKYFINKHNPVNLSAYIRQYDDYIATFNSNKFFYFCAICAGLYLIPLTSYGNMTEDTSEMNNQLQYAVGMPLWMSVFIRFIWNVYPILLIMVIRNFHKTFSCILALVLLVVGVLLGSKTNLFFNTTAVLIYFYSKYKGNITKKKIITIGLIGILGGSIVFSILQTFRQVKTYAVDNMTNHSFGDVVQLALHLDPATKLMMQMQLDRYYGRAMNVFDAYDWAMQGSYRGNGHLTNIVYSYIIPQRTRNDGNIMGDKMAGLGADIGESLLSWFVCDWGEFFGVFVAMATLILLFWLIKIYFRGCAQMTKMPLFNLLSFTLILNYTVGIENNPSGCIHMFYSDYLYMVISIWLIWKLYILFSPTKKQIRR